MKTILWAMFTSLLLNSFCFAQIRGKAADSAEAIEAIQRQQQDQIEAQRAIQEKVSKQRKQDIEEAKKRFWVEQVSSTSPEEKTEAARAIQSIRGPWSEGEGKERHKVAISQKEDEFTARCTYRHPKHGEIQWKFVGTITNEGFISGHLDHIKSPKGWTGQDRIAVVSADGSTISGRAVFDTGGGHDFVWKRDGGLSQVGTKAEGVGIEDIANFRKNSPKAVCAYLEKSGLTTGRYQKAESDNYFACSTYKNVGAGTPPCNLAYYVEGTATSVKNVYLTLNVNNPEGAKKGHAEFLAASQDLVKKATEATLPQEVRKSIEEGRKGDWKLGESLLKIERTEFMGTIKGYQLTFRIE